MATQDSSETEANELDKVLNARRAVVEKRGKHFVAAKLQTDVSKADFVHNDRTAEQFTPKSRRAKAWEDDEPPPPKREVQVLTAARAAAEAEESVVTAEDIEEKLAQSKVKAAAARSARTKAAQERQRAKLAEARARAQSGSTVPGQDTQRPGAADAGAGPGARAEPEIQQTLCRTDQANSRTRSPSPHSNPFAIGTGLGKGEPPLQPTMVHSAPTGSSPTSAGLRRLTAEEVSPKAKVQVASPSSASSAPASASSSVPFRVNPPPAESRTGVNRMVSAPSASATSQATRQQPRVQPPQQGGVSRMSSMPVIGSSGPGRPGAFTPAAPSTIGDPMIWRAVVEGDIQRLEEIANRGGLPNGRVLDHNSHSVLWNAIAFQQIELASWLLKRFPPSSPLGVDVEEVHERRKDTLLHLCLYLTDFTTTAREVFRIIFDSLSSSKALREMPNAAGQNFLHLAAARGNFWTLKTVLSSAPEMAAIMQQPDGQGTTAIEALVRRIREAGAPPVKPTSIPQPEAHLPDWSPLAQYMPTGYGLVPPQPPFADLQLEVEDSNVQGGVARVGVHRVIVCACSGKLGTLVKDLPRGKPLRLDPLCCRSGEVLMVVLRFLYGAQIQCDFMEDAFLLWQLLCLCAQYGLPAPLTRFARISLVRTIGEPRHAAVLTVLLQASDKVGLTATEGYYAGCSLLGSREGLANLGGEKQAKVLVAALDEVERGFAGSSVNKGVPRVVAPPAENTSPTAPPTPATPTRSSFGHHPAPAQTPPHPMMMGSQSVPHPMMGAHPQMMHHRSSTALLSARSHQMGPLGGPPQVGTMPAHHHLGEPMHGRMPGHGAMTYR